MYTDNKIFMGPEGATGGSAEEPVVQDQTPETPPDFDPSSVDVTDPDALASLSDEQIASVSEFNRKQTETGGAPVKDTAQEGDGEPVETPATAPVKYAGKYDSADALAQGVLEIAKKLSYNADAVQAMIDLAKETKNFGKLEVFYKSLEKALHDRPVEVPRPEATPVKDTVVDDTPDPKLMEAVSNTTLSELSRSELGRQMASRNIPVPRNMAEFQELVDAHPYFAAEFKREYAEVFAKNLESAQGHLNAKREVETANKTAVDADVAALKKLAEETGFKLSDDEIAAVRAEAMQRGASYDDRYGVKFLRAGAIKEHFLATRLLDKLAEIRLAAETAGRSQAVADLKKSEAKPASTISTSRLSTKTRAEAKVPDLSDPDVVASLPDEALNDPDRYYRNLRK